MGKGKKQQQSQAQVQTQPAGATPVVIDKRPEWPIRFGFNDDNYLFCDTVEINMKEFNHNINFFKQYEKNRLLLEACDHKLEMFNDDKHVVSLRIYKPDYDNFCKRHNYELVLTKHSKLIKLAREINEKWKEIRLPQHSWKSGYAVIGHETGVFYCKGTSVDNAARVFLKEFLFYRETSPPDEKLMVLNLENENAPIRIDGDIMQDGDIHDAKVWYDTFCAPEKKIPDWENAIIPKIKEELSGEQEYRFALFKQSKGKLIDASNSIAELASHLYKDAIDDEERINDVIVFVDSKRLNDLFINDKGIVAHKTPFEDKTDPHYNVLVGILGIIRRDPKNMQLNRGNLLDDAYREYLEKIEKSENKENKN